MLEMLVNDNAAAGGHVDRLIAQHHRSPPPMAGPAGWALRWGWVGLAPAMWLIPLSAAPAASAERQHPGAVKIFGPAQQAGDFASSSPLPPSGWPRRCRSPIGCQPAKILQVPARDQPRALFALDYDHRDEFRARCGQPERYSLLISFDMAAGPANPDGSASVQSGWCVVRCRPRAPG